MHSFKCDTCKLYKKHSKNVEVLSRFSVRMNKLDKEIENSVIYSGINFWLTEAFLLI